MREEAQGLYLDNQRFKVGNVLQEQISVIDLSCYSKAQWPKILYDFVPSVLFLSVMHNVLDLNVVAPFSTADDFDKRKIL
jgi:hypothetical protein